MGMLDASGAATGATTETSLTSHAPATGEPLGSVRTTPPGEVAKVVARAKRAQAAWAVLPVAERCERLLRFRDAMVDAAEEVVDVISRECGKPREDALSELTIAVDLLTHYCRRAPEILAEHELGLHLFKHKKSTVSWTPRGVVALVTPWNFPFVIPMGDVAAALASGNAVVVKPSEVTPLTMAKAKQIFDATGLPEDLLCVVQGGPDTAQALIESGIQKLVFTGGVETGRKVAAACGANLVPCVMELGGKAPLVVCSDADVETTARAIVFGGFFAAGQACICVERVYAHHSIHDALVARVSELTRQLRTGDPGKDTVDVGAIVYPRQIAVAERLIADALEKGAELVIGGRRLPGPGQFFEPTVLTRCDHTMAIMREEIFGPVVPIMKVASEDEAVRLANDSHLGLAAYVFTKDRAKGKRLADRIEAGSVVVNDVIAHYGVAEAPFGGIKQSGFGRVHGDDALRDMCDAKHVMSSRVPELGEGPLWFPYSAKAYRWRLRLVQALYSRAGIVKRLGKLF